MLITSTLALIALLTKSKSHCPASKVLHVDLRRVEDDKLVDVTGELDASGSV